MPIKLEVVRSDLLFEAAFPRPEFVLHQNPGILLDRLHRRLEGYGVKLTDIRVERGGGSLGDHHLLLYLFDYWMTIKLHIDRVEVRCTSLPQELVEKFKAAILDVLQAVKDSKPDISFRAFAVAVGLHVKIEGQTPRGYLARFVTNAPMGLGPATGSGIVFYFGPEEDRLWSTVTTDLSAVVPDALFLRVHGLWDATRVAPEALARSVEGFVRRAIESLDLQLPA